jgi:uncharacterized membrane protein (DUF485 family)
MQSFRQSEGISLTAPIRAHPAFRPLVRKRRNLAILLTILMLAVYFGFIFLVAFAPGILSRPVWRTITLGFPLGLGVIVSAIVLTGIYVLSANAEFDPLTRRVVEDAP